MDTSENMLFDHITVVINLLHTFSDIGNITKPHLIRRLDYLYERL